MKTRNFCPIYLDPLGYRTFNEYLDVIEKQENELTEDDIKTYLSTCFYEYRYTHPSISSTIYGEYVRGLRELHSYSDMMKYLMLEFNDVIFKLKRHILNIVFNIDVDNHDNIIESNKFKQLCEMYNFRYVHSEQIQNLHTYKVTLEPISTICITEEVLNDYDGILYYATDDDIEASYILKNGLYNRSLSTTHSQSHYAYTDKICFYKTPSVSRKHIFKIDINKMIESYCIHKFDDNGNYSLNLFIDLDNYDIVYQYLYIPKTCIEKIR